MTRAVFLDRDGVIVRSRLVDGMPRPPRSLEELELLPGVVEACRLLRRAGYELVVATNQPDVARGTLDSGVVDAFNAALLELLPLRAVYVCFHDDSDGCACRKPAPGLLLEAARAWGIDLASSYMVGDRWRDVEAGLRAGCRTARVGDGYGERAWPVPNFVGESLLEVALWIRTNGRN